MARVLVVDDNADILYMVTLQLRRAGHSVAGAANGAEALALVDRRGAPDLAVLDVAMPGIDGFELVDELRARPGCAELPIIFLSAKTQPEAIARGRSLGAVYLTKPFVAAALLDAIERATPASQATW